MAFKSISAAVASSNNVSASLTLTPVLPTRATDDLLLAVTSTRSITATVATPAGWTLWPGFPKRSTTVSGSSVYVFYKVVVGGETNPALAWTGLTSGTAGDSTQACVMCLSDCDVSAPSGGTPPAPTDVNISGTSTGPDPGVLGAGMVLSIFTKVLDTASSATPGANYTERGDFHTTTGTGHLLYLQTRDWSGGSSPGTAAATFAPTSSGRSLGISLGIKASPPPVPVYTAVLDDFNRADNVVDAGAGAALWTRAMIDGTATSTDIRTYSNAVGSGAGNVWRSSFTKKEIDNSSGNCDILIDNVAVPVGPNNEFGFWCLVTNPGTTTHDAYAVFFAGGTWILRRYANGVNMGNITSAAGTLAAGDTIWFQKRGSSLSVNRQPSGGSFARILNATDANHNPPSGVVGIELSDSTQRWDNLRGGPFTAPVSGFPAVSSITLDSFNRADEWPLSGGGQWVTPTFNDKVLAVYSNQLGRDAGAEATWGSANLTEPFGPDQEAFATWADTSGVGTNGIELLLRVQNPNLSNIKAYLCTVDKAGTWTMWCNVSGNQVQIGAAGSSPAISNGDKIGFRIVGSTLTAYHYRNGNWYLVMTRTDATYTGTGSVGLTIQDQASRVDDFSGGPPGGSPARSAADSWTVTDSTSHVLISKLIIPVKAGGNYATKSPVNTSPFGLSITVPAGGHQVGNLVLIAVHIDHSTTSEEIIYSVAGSRGNTWEPLAEHSAGVAPMSWLVIGSILDVALQGGDIITLTFTGNITLDKATIQSAEFANVTNELDGVSTNFYSAGTTSPTILAASPDQANSLTMAFASWVGPVTDTITEDADTVGGTPWTSTAKLGTSGQGAATNCFAHGAFKVGKTTNTYEYNPVNNNSRAVHGVIFSLLPKHVGPRKFARAPTDAWTVSDSVTRGQTLVPGVASYARVVLDDSPVVFWPLDDAPGSTTARDLAGVVSPATITGSAVFDGSSVHLDDSATVVVNRGTPGFDTAWGFPWPDEVLGASSIEVWATFDVAAQTAYFMSLDAYGGALMNFAEHSAYGGLTLQVSGNTGITGPHGATVTGKLYHLVGTWDGAVSRFYVNGALVGIGAYNVLSRLYGCNINGRAGRYKNAAFYKHALSAARIREHYRVGTSTPDTVDPASIPGLRAWYAPDGLAAGGITTWKDQSASGQHLSGSGPTQVATLSGHPVVSFDGTDDGLNSVGMEVGISAATRAMTVIQVFRKTGASNVYEALPATLTRSNAGAPLDAYNDSVFVNGLGTSSWPDVRTATTWQTWAIDLTVPEATGIASVHHYVNGALAKEFTQAGAAAWNVDWQTITVGARHDLATRFRGDLAEALIYDRVLTTIERQQVEEYLGVKYFGVQLPPSEPPPPMFTRLVSDTVAFFDSAFGKKGVGRSAADSWAVSSSAVGVAVIAPKQASDVWAVSDVVTRQRGAALPAIPMGMAGWYRADALARTDGQAVGVWTDSSGNGNDATSAPGPTYRTNQINGQPAISFDGADDSIGLPAISAAAPDRTVFAVVSVANFSAYRAVLGASAGSGLEWRINLTTAGRQAVLRQAAANIAQSTVSLVAGTPAMIGFYFTSAGGMFRLNRADSGAIGATGTFAAGTTAAIGAQGVGGGERYMGLIAELLIYDRVLTSTERGEVENYLYEKYWGAPSSPMFTRPVSDTWAVSDSVASTQQANLVRTATDSWVASSTTTYVKVVPRGAVDSWTVTETVKRGPGVSYDTATEAYLAATGLDPTYAPTLNALVVGLKSAGLWTKMTAVYPFIGGTADLHKWNLKDPRDADDAYRLTYSGPNGIHSTSMGYRPNATHDSTNNYADTHLIPAGTLDPLSVHLSLYSLSALGSAPRCDMGNYNWGGGGGRFHLIVHYTNGEFYFNLGHPGPISTYAAGDGSGLFVSSRVNGGAEEAFLNGIEIADGSSAVELPPTSVLVGGLNGYPREGSDLPFGFASIGAGLTAQNIADLYTVVQAFQANRGVSFPPLDAPMFTRIASDVVAFADVAAKTSSTKVVNAVDTVLVSSTASRTTGTKTRTAVDSWACSDSAAAVKTGGAPRSTTDVVVMSDVAVRAAATKARTAVDAWSRSDSASGMKVIPRGAVDLWVVTETVKRGPGVPLYMPALPGLAGWYDAAQLSLADGAAVTSWTDLSGQGRHLPPYNGNSPLLRTNVLNGLPVVRFDGVDDGFFLPTFFVFRQVFIVAKYPSATFVGFEGLLSNGGGGSYDYMMVGGGPGTTWFYTSPHDHYLDGVLYPGNHEAPMGRFGVLSASQVAAWNYQMLVGSDRGNPGRYWPGDVAEIVFYDRVLSDTERQQVEDYLTAKWLGAGISAPPMFTRTAVDLVGTSDSAGRAATKARTAIDSWSRSDSAAGIKVIPRGAVDSWAVGDVVTRISGKVRPAVDVVVISDSAVRAAAKARPAADAWAVADTVLRTPEKLRTVTDVWTVIGTVTRIVARPRPASDVVVFSDTATRAIAGKVRIATDLWVVSSSALRSIVFTRAAYDMFIVVDLALRKPTLPRLIVDIFTVSDIVEAQTGVTYTRMTMIL